MIWRRSIAAIALPALLTACMHPQRPDPVAERIETWFLKTRGQACGVARYKSLGHSERGSFFIKSRNGGGPAPIPMIGYTVKCGQGGIYWMEIPDDPGLNAWIIYCVNGVRAFRSGCRMWQH